MQEQAVGGHVDIFLIRPDELQVFNQSGVQGRFTAQNQNRGKVLLGYRGNGQLCGRFVRGRRVAAPLNAECTGGVALVRDFYIQTVAVAAGAGVFRTDRHVGVPPFLSNCFEHIRKAESPACVVDPFDVGQGIAGQCFGQLFPVVFQTLAVGELAERLQIFVEDGSIAEHIRQPLSQSPGRRRDNWPG